MLLPFASTCSANNKVIAPPGTAPAPPSTATTRRRRRRWRQRYSSGPGYVLFAALRLFDYLREYLNEIFMPENSNKYTHCHCRHCHHPKIICEHFIDGCAVFGRQSSSSLSCVSHNWYCNFKSLSHLTPTEYVFLDFSLRECSTGVHRTFTWYHYTHIYLRVFSFLSATSSSSSSAFYYVP